jgi:hypothetical protein
MALARIIAGKIIPIPHRTLLLYRLAIDQIGFIRKSNIAKGIFAKLVIIKRLILLSGAISFSLITGAQLLSGV